MRVSASGIRPVSGRPGRSHSVRSGPGSRSRARGPARSEGVRPESGLSRTALRFNRGRSVVVVAAFAAALLAAALPVAASAAVSPRPAWILDGAQDSAYLGWSVGTAGDVNGDGYSDVIVGEPYYDVVQFFLVNVGRARIFLGGPNGVSTVASWSVIGGSNSAFGYSVGTAGDVNGDGYDDVIVGAPDYSNGQNQEGGAWLYLGGPDGPDTTADWMREGGQATANLGLSVATAGDVNGGVC